MRQNPRRRAAYRVGFAAALLLWTLPWTSQAAVLASHWAECGHAPVVGDNFAASAEYYLPSDGGYWGHALAIFPLFRPSAYWCTETEAEFGYHHAVYPWSWI